MPISNSAFEGLGMAGDPERAKAGGGAAKQILEAGILVGELERLGRKSSWLRQLMPRRQIAAAIDGCVLRAARALQARQRLERALVADLSQRQRGIVLKRAIQRGDSR